MQFWNLEKYIEMKMDWAEGKKDIMKTSKKGCKHIIISQEPEHSYNHLLMKITNFNESKFPKDR